MKSGVHAHIKIALGAEQAVILFKSENILAPKWLHHPLSYCERHARNRIALDKNALAILLSMEEGN